MTQAGQATQPATSPEPDEMHRIHSQVICEEGALPHFPTTVFHTGAGTPYLKEPGVTLLSRPHVSIAGLAGFLTGFAEELNFPQYLEDPTPLTPGAQLCKTAGQLCYASFAPRRTYNADAARYFANILESGHGSVLEHANYTLLLFGVSRSLTHELVRHRAGVALSQVSQRYVSGKVLRFVERPEYRNDPELHAAFERRIDVAASDYARITQRLLEKQREGTEILSADARTDLRKKVQQSARSVLPNETEAPIVVTANVRAWRHILEMRASSHAETEIREMAFRAYLCLYAAEPTLFADYQIVRLGDGTYALHTDHAKV